MGNDDQHMHINAGALRTYSPAILAIAAPIVALGVAATMGFMWSTNNSMILISDRQERIKSDISEIKASIAGVQTQAQAREQYNRLDSKIDGKYSELKDYTLGIDNRVRSLEMRQ